MLTILAQQASGVGDTEQLGNLLKYGQMGLALAILIVGAGLFTAALKQQNLSQTTAGVLKLFAGVMVILFVVSSIGEMATKIMDFWDRHRPVFATVELPPLNERNYKDYGPIEIKIVDNSASNQVAPIPASQPRNLSIHNGSLLYIDLDSLTSQVSRSQNIAASAISQVAGKSNTLGSGGAQ
jgi:hypothetical protein